jgi:RNA polymerase sigma-70 factor (ECF subfamily)
MANAAIPAESTDDDGRLMLAYARGDARAFEVLYAKHKGATYRYFLRHVRGRASEADELHQDLWLRVVGARQRYAPGAKFSTWLYTLARHRLIDHWRAAGAAAFESIDEDEGQAAAEIAAATADGGIDGPLRATMNAETGRRLVTALQGMPAAQRDAFLLHVESGLSLGEIAALTSAGEETIKSRLRYAYRKLRAALEDLQ